MKLKNSYDTFPMLTLVLFYWFGFCYVGLDWVLVYKFISLICELPFICVFRYACFVPIYVKRIKIDDGSLNLYRCSKNRDYRRWICLPVLNKLIKMYSKSNAYSLGLPQYFFGFRNVPRTMVEGYATRLRRTKQCTLRQGVQIPNQQSHTCFSNLIAKQRGKHWRGGCRSD